MNNFAILSDSCCDLPQEIVTQYDLRIAPLSVEYADQVFDDGAMDAHTFYEGIRQGRMPKTAAVNPQRWGELMRNALEQGQDVLALCFSSALSTTYQSAVIAAGELQEEFPQRKILVVDTRCASLGHGLMVWHAARRREAGDSIGETRDWVEAHIPNICHWFTVDDLMHLKRGGRVSAATAVVGTMLQIKPVLYVDDEGLLATAAKARGQKAAVHLMVEKMTQTALPGQNDTVFIGHGDCPAQAQALAQMLRDSCGVKHTVITPVGNVIGAHTGPDTLVLIFLGSHR